MKTNMPPSDEYAEFEDWVWRRLPASKFIAGRRRVLDLVPSAIDLWSDDMAQATDESHASFTFMADSLRYTVRTRYANDRFGTILIIILSALIGELVRLLIQWWLSRDSHRTLFARWRRRARDG